MLTMNNYKYNQQTAFVAASYQKSSENFFMTAKKPKTQYKTMNQLLKECALLGSTQHGLNYIA